MKIIFIYERKEIIGPTDIAPQVKKSYDIKVPDSPRPIIGRIEGDSTGINAGDDEFDTLGAEPPSDNEDIINIPNNSDQLVPFFPGSSTSD